MKTYEKTEIDYLLENTVNATFTPFSKHAVLPHYQTPLQFKAYCQWFWLFHNVCPGGFASLPVQSSGVVGQGVFI